MAENGADKPTAALDATRAKVLEAYLATSPKSPLRVLGNLQAVKVPQEGLALALSETEVTAFRGKLVDRGLLPETTTEVGISDEDMTRLDSMTPDKRAEAVQIAIRNITLKVNGLAEVPGGVKFQRIEVNNRTGERKPVTEPPVKPPTTP